MTQRLATAEDIPALVEMGRKFHAMSPHVSMGAYDAEAIERMVRFMIESPQSVVLTNGTGAIGAVYAPVYFCPSKWMCEESYWWAEKDGMALLDGLLEHARGWGAGFLYLSTLENALSPVVDRLLRRRGFKLLERRYMLEIAP